MSTYPWYGKIVCMNICIIVPIKTINERLAGKTTRLLNGKPLYSYLFETLRKVAKLYTVYVDSSDEIILTIAKKWGFQTLKRPEQYNKDNITGDDLLMRVVHNLDYDIIGLLHITSPFLSVETIETAIRLLIEETQLDSVMGILPRFNRFWFDRKPINHDLTHLVRTQDLNPIYEETDVYFVRRTSLIKFGKRICGNYKFIEMGEVESVDIDTIEDLIYAGALIDAGFNK
jgi:N-acylneuraminate cytidylyltransferase